MGGRRNLTIKVECTLSSYQENRRGIIALTSACALFTFNDTLAKLTALIYPPGEVLFARGVGSMICVTVVLIYAHQLSWLVGILKPIVILRAALDAIANTAFILALTHMRLADLLAVNLVSPLLLTMLMAFFFNEPVGWRRWTAILVGLIGMLVIVKPNTNAFSIWALVAFAAAVASALRDLTTRRIATQVPTLAITFVSVIAVTSSGLILALGFGEQWALIEPKYLGFIGFAALALSVSTPFGVSAFRNVDISVVAPFRYTLLIWGAVAGYLVFNEVPDGWSLFGSSLIVGSGLYTLHRERVRHRETSAKAAIH
jgi:drug/metabolite transporter (DMT)-like permease